MVVDVLEDDAAKPRSGQAEPGQAVRTFRVSVPRELFERDQSLRLPFDVFPDGKGFLKTSSEDAESGASEGVVNELIITLNYFEELRRLAPAKGSQK